MKKMKYLQLARLTNIFIFLLFSTSIFAVENNEILVFTGSESSDGVTENDFDMQMLSAIELQTKTKVKEKMIAYLSSEGFKEPKFNVNSSSVYVNAQGMKLAVVKLRIESTNQVHIYGIRGGELLRVACVRKTKETIPISYGKCGDAIKKIYGVDISKGSN